MHTGVYKKDLSECSFIENNLFHSHRISHSVTSIELNITGRLPLAGDLKPLVPSLFTHYQTRTFNLRENPMSVL